MIGNSTAVVPATSSAVTLNAGFVCADASVGLSSQPSFDIDAELETVQGEQKRLRREKRRMVRA